MATFTICTFKGKPAVQYHHDFGDFEFVIIQDEEDEHKIAFRSNVLLTNRLYDMIGEKAIKQLKFFGKRFGFSPSADLSFNEIVQILQEAKTYAQKQQQKLAQK